MWTMITIARTHKNEELEAKLRSLSIGYANLASCLLCLVDDLEETGHNELATQILELNDIDPLDAIIDIQELYNPENIDINNLIKAITVRLENLQELAHNVLMFDDIKEQFFVIIQFTDLNSNLLDISELEDYITKIGSINK